MTRTVANRSLCLVVVLLMSIALPGRAASDGEPPPIVRSKQSERIINALVGPVVFIAAESAPADAPVSRSWSAEENHGGFVSRITGTLDRGDLSFVGRRIVVRASGYVLKCLVGTEAKRNEECKDTSQKIVSYDGSPALFEVEESTSVFIGPLECTLETPDARTFTGVGSYQKTSQHERRNALLP